MEYNLENADLLDWLYWLPDHRVHARVWIRIQELVRCLSAHHERDFISAICNGTDVAICPLVDLRGPAGTRSCLGTGQGTRAVLWLADHSKVVRALDQDSNRLDWSVAEAL